MKLEDAAAELYGVPPDEFMATRRALQRRGRANGEREPATEIGKLRRPSTAAWVVDLMEALRASVEAARGHRPGNRRQGGKPTTRKAGGDDAGDDLDDLPKRDLYAPAQDLDVPGRSAMGHGELVAAIREARGSGRRAAS